MILAMAAPRLLASLEVHLLFTGPLQYHGTVAPQVVMNTQDSLVEIDIEIYTVYTLQVFTILNEGPTPSAISALLPLRAPFRSLVINVNWNTIITCSLKAAWSTGWDLISRG